MINQEFKRILDNAPEGATHYVPETREQSSGYIKSKTFNGNKTWSYLEESSQVWECIEEEYIEDRISLAVIGSLSLVAKKEEITKPKTYCMQIIKFKKSGKFYDYNCLETECELMYQVVEDFEQYLYTEMYDYVITGDLCEADDPSKSVGEHPNGYPCLIKGSYL